MLNALLDYVAARLLRWSARRLSVRPARLPSRDVEERGEDTPVEVPRRQTIVPARAADFGQDLAESGVVPTAPAPIVGDEARALMAPDPEPAPEAVRTPRACALGSAADRIAAARRRREGRD